MKCINLACGPVYITSKGWTNADYKSSRNVIGCDLLGSLPFAAGKFDLVYSSHFFEHIPRSSVASFLSECKRILMPGGCIRLVLPDAEEMFSAYLRYRSSGMHEEADFLIIEIIDQCVRQRSGGELADFYAKIHKMERQDAARWGSFVASRNGEGLDHEFIPNTILTSRGVVPRALIEKVATIPSRLYRRLRTEVHQLGLQLLLPAFQRQNVSLASIGEKHHWLWDFHQLKTALEQAGFSCVTRQTHTTSTVEDFPFVPLDATIEGRPRKGCESMYVEAKS
jgi:predicted SAM-dependent methyltransferase